MKVKYKNDSLSDGTDFTFKVDDYVTIVVRYWVKKLCWFTTIPPHALFNAFLMIKNGEN